MKVREASDIQLLNEWATPLFVGDYDDTGELNRQLLELILAREAEFLAKREEAPGGEKPFPQFWNCFSQLHVEQHLFDWPSDAIREVHAMVEQACIRYLKEGFRLPEIPRYSLKGWANVSRKADWHGCHSHYAGGRERISGVYWVSVPAPDEESNELNGDFILYDPRGPYYPARYKKIFRPKAGRMLLQPSWLAHSVAPNRSDELRVSIAFDMSILD
jgi:putative 2-oxoglutarate-Fe(II)-dependent oxygenase superfamily protein